MVRNVSKLTYLCLQKIYFLYHPWTKFRGYIGITLSICRLSCRFVSCLLLDHHTIHSTWVYYHKRMCCVNSWSRYDIDFELKVKFIGFCVWATPFFSIDVVIPYLAHGCITIGWCVTYNHYLCMTLKCDLNIKLYIYIWASTKFGT